MCPVGAFPPAAPHGARPACSKHRSKSDHTICPSMTFPCWESVVARHAVRACRAHRLLASIALLLQLIGASRTGATPPPPWTERTALTNEHVDLRLVLRPGESNELALIIRDEDHGIEYDPTNVVLRLPESAQISIPAGFGFFGPEGSPIWIAPQSQNPSLLYIGLSAEGIAPGSFAAAASLNLVAHEGGGDFFLWQFDAFSGLNLLMNSRDGITGGDALPMLPGGHQHMNWGFTSNGFHGVTFQAVARRPGATNDITSALTTVLFAIDPVPEPPALTAFEQWQAENWPGVSDTAIAGADADPDGDGMPNAVEFAAGTDPKNRASTPDFHVDLPAAIGGRTHGSPALVGRLDRKDLVDVTFQAAPEPGWSNPVTLVTQAVLPFPAEEPFTRCLWAAADPEFADATKARYYRVGVRIR